MKKKQFRKERYTKFMIVWLMKAHRYLWAHL